MNSTISLNGGPLLSNSFTHSNKNWAEDFFFLDDSTFLKTGAGFYNLWYTCVKNIQNHWPFWSLILQRAWLKPTLQKLWISWLKFYQALLFRSCCKHWTEVTFIIWTPSACVNCWLWNRRVCLVFVKCEGRVGPGHRSTANQCFRNGPSSTRSHISLLKGHSDVQWKNGKTHSIYFYFISIFQFSFFIYTKLQTYNTVDTRV